MRPRTRSASDRNNGSDGQKSVKDTGLRSEGDRDAGLGDGDNPQSPMNDGARSPSGVGDNGQAFGDPGIELSTHTGPHLGQGRVDGHSLSVGAGALRASQQATIRASIGISSPARPSG